MATTGQLERAWKELLSLTQAAESQVVMDIVHNGNQYSKEERQRNLASIKQKIAEIEALHRA